MAITKVSGHVIEPTTNIQAGIITATRFDGPIGTGSTDGNFSGIVTTGELKANGIGVTSLSVTGVSTLTGDVSIGSSLLFGNNKKVLFGDNAGGYLEVYNSGSDSFIKSHTDDLWIYGHDNIFLAGTTSNHKYLRTVDGGGVFLYHNNSSKFETTNTGTITIGICSATDFSGVAGGAADFPNGLTGTTATFSGSVSIGGTLTYEDVTNIDSVGIVTARAGIIDSTLTAGRVVYADTDKSLTDNAKLTFDGNQLLVARNLSTAANDSVTGSEFRAGMLYFRSRGDSAGISGTTYANQLISSNGSNVPLEIYTQGSATNTPIVFGVNVVEKFRIHSTGVNVKGDIDLDNGGSAGVNFKRNGTLKSDIEIGSSSDQLAIRARGSSGFISLHTNTSTAERLRITSAGNVKVPDNGKIELGGAQTGSGDLQIYHASSDNNSYIVESGSGSLMIQGDVVNIGNVGSTKYYIRAYEDDRVELRHSQSTKLATSATGITVTGEVAATQDYPTIKPTLDLNFAATKALDPRIEYYRYGPASYIDENGKVVLVGEDVPRFDHDPDTGECKGLLVEGERRNYFPNGVRPGDKWTGSKGGSTWTENTTETTAPDGTYTATKWAFTSTDPYLYHQQTLNAGVTYTMSVWVKAGTNMSGDVLQMRMGAAPYSTNANSTLPTDGSWKRLTFTKTIGGSNETNVNVGFEPQTNPSGNPASGDVIYVWGAQLESGTTASSFIPTYGYTQARGPDVVQITGEEFSDFYNQIEGTIFLSASYETDARAASIVTIDDTSAYANYTEVGYRAGGASSGQVSSYSRTTAGNDQYYKNWVSSATQGNEFKIAFAYKDDDYASSGNGETAHTDNSGTTHKEFDRLKFSEVHTVGHGGVGHYRRLMYYPKRITNTQLVTLTS